MKNTLKKLFTAALVTVAMLTITGCGGEKTPKEKYTEYYKIVRMTAGEDSFTGEDLFPLGYSDNFIGFTSETTGVLQHMGTPMEFTTEDGTHLKFDDFEMDILREEGKISFGLNYSDFYYEKAEPRENVPVSNPPKGIYELYTIHYDNIIKDHGMIGVSKEYAGTYIEIFGEDKGEGIFSPSGLRFEIQDGRFSAGEDSIAFLQKDDMIVLRFDNRTVNTYKITDKYPTKLVDHGTYIIKSIAYDGNVFEGDSLQSTGLADTKLVIENSYAGELYMNGRTIPFLTIGDAIGFSDFETTYYYIDNTLTTDIQGMTFEFEYISD